MPAITIDELQGQLQARRQFWQPARDRMDLWQLMVMLVDLAQATKPGNYKRFVSAEPHATVMLARSILSRNPLMPFIPLRDINREEELDESQNVEKLIIGMFNDVDRVLIGRGMQKAQSIAALHLLVRGWAVSHLVLREDWKAQKMLTPIDYEPWDMRFFLPAFDRRGYLHSCIHESFPSWSELVSDYPHLDEKTDKWKMDYNTTVHRLDWWDQEYHAVAFLPNMAQPINHQGGMWLPASFQSKAKWDCEWAEEPNKHGLDRIPVVCVSANGLPFDYTPNITGAWPPVADPGVVATRNAQAQVGRRATWLGPGGYVASWGRSILAAVEDLVPAYNEAMALIMQVVYNDAYGTWLTQTFAGDLTEVQVGGVNALKVGEAMARVGGISASPDLYRILGVIRDSYQRGTFSDALFGLTGFQGSGFLQTQLKNAALNNLDPYIEAHKNWGTHTAQLALNQMHQAPPKDWEIWGQSNDMRHFRVTVEPETVAKLWPIEMKPTPALPDDLALRVDIARRMLDPNMPLASYQTVLDRVLEFGDAQREKKLMFDDIAERDPSIVFLRVQQRLIARGMDDLAKAFGDRAFAAAFLEEAARVQAMGKAKMMMQGGLSPAEGMGEPGGGTGAGPMNISNGAEQPGFDSASMPPEMGVGPTEGSGGSMGPVI